MGFKTSYIQVAKHVKQHGPNSWMHKIYSPFTA